MSKLSKLPQNVTDFFINNWIIFTIFLTAFIVRIVWLETLPATFFVDEVLSGYLGRFMLINGRDLYGNSHPWLYFNKFGDYYILLPMYLDGLSTFIFGVTRFATRFPTALIGSLMVFPMYGISNSIFHNKKVGLLSGMLIALLPWHVVLSRTTTESVIELTILALVIWLLLLANDRKQLYWIFVGLVLSGLSYLIYHTARMLTPLLWLGYLITFYPSLKKEKKSLGVVLIGVLLFFTATLLISTTDWGRGRLTQTSIFSQQSGVSIRMTEMTYNLGNNAVLMARIFHNKIIGHGREFINQYLSYFDPTFLFTTDAWSGTRYAVPEIGPVYLALLLMLICIFLPTQEKNTIKNSGKWWLLWILLIAPAPASLTFIESPNIRRSLMEILPLTIFAGYGWYRSFGIGWHKLKLGYFLTILICIETILFGYYFIKQSDFVNAIYRSDGMPEIAAYALKQSVDMRLLITSSDDFPLYYLFAKNDFANAYADKFKFKLNIDHMDMVYPRPEKCASDLQDVIASPSANILIIEPAWCNQDPTHFQYLETISGVNPLVKFNVLKPR